MRVNRLKQCSLLSLLLSFARQGEDLLSLALASFLRRWQRLLDGPISDCWNCHGEGTVDTDAEVFACSKCKGWGVLNRKGEIPKSYSQYTG